MNYMCVQHYLKTKHLKVYSLIRSYIHICPWNHHHDQESEDIRPQIFLVPLCDFLPLPPPCLTTSHLQAKINLLSVSPDCIFWNFIWTKSHSIFFFEGGSLASLTQHNGNLCWDLLMWLVSIVHCFYLLSSKHSILWIWIFLPQVVSAFTCGKTFRLLGFGYYRHSYFVRFCSLYG